MNSIEHSDLCLKIATEAHEGQFRRGGERYISHPIRVASSFDQGSTARCIAYLHDVLEDCSDWTGLRLMEAGVQLWVVNSVERLTKKPVDSYYGYLSGLLDDHLAKRVKVADMLDNLTDAPTLKQVKKYKAGILYLL